MMPAQIMLVFRPDADAQPRLLLGEEALLMQGFPVSLMTPAAVSETTNALMADIAGNMVSLPVLLALTMATIAAIPWRAPTHATPPGPANDEDIDTALAVFALCAGDADVHEVA